MDNCSTNKTCTTCDTVIFKEMQILRILHLVVVVVTLLKPKHVRNLAQQNVMVKRSDPAFFFFFFFFTNKVLFDMGNDNPQTTSLYQANLRHALVAGAMAGTIVDSVLFPLGNNLKQSTRKSPTNHSYRYHQNSFTNTSWICCFWRIPRRIFRFTICICGKCSKW